MNQNVVARASVVGLISFVWLLIGNITAQANSFQYSYDDDGRLVEVVDTSGDGAHYVYDASGNLTSRYQVSASQLHVVSFEPVCGAAGTTVHINGTGFSTSPSQNTVTFGSGSTTATSASTTQIVATVPAGATTGKISVHPSGSPQAVSRTEFTIGCGQPTITTVSPTNPQMTDIITITGTGFEQSAIHNRVSFGGQLAAVIPQAPPGSTTTIQVLLSPTIPQETSGQISVTTPRGTALSAQSITVQ